MLSSDVPKQKETHKETDLWFPEWGRGKDCKFGINGCKLLYTEWVNNKVLLYSTGTIFTILQ